MGVRDREAERRAALTIARNIRHIIKERGMTQADLARLTGLMEPTVNRHLIVDETPDAKRVQRCPTVALLLRYSDALGVSVDDLLGREPDRRWADPDIQSFFESYYQHLEPEWRSWCRVTIDLLRQTAKKEATSRLTGAERRGRAPSREHLTERYAYQR